MPKLLLKSHFCLGIDDQTQWCLSELRSVVKRCMMPRTMSQSRTRFCVPGLPSLRPSAHLVYAGKDAPAPSSERSVMLLSAIFIPIQCASMDFVCSSRRNRLLSPAFDRDKLQTGRTIKLGGIRYQTGFETHRTARAAVERGW